MTKPVMMRHRISGKVFVGFSPRLQARRARPHALPPESVLGLLESPPTARPLSSLDKAYYQC